MMEVARKGIFHPQFFTMPELMTIFLAVMLTDIILLDVYNTFGLPTSTTVSIVFELLGAAVALSGSGHEAFASAPGRSRWQASGWIPGNARRWHRRRPGGRRSGPG